MAAVIFVGVLLWCGNFIYVIVMVVSKGIAGLRAGDVPTPLAGFYFRRYICLTFTERL
jgi:hypothetical protein